MAEIIPIDAQGEPEEKTPVGWHRYWLAEKEAADKRLKEYIRQGNAVVSRFLDERQSATDYKGSGDVPSRLNLFWKNVKTTQDMLFGSTPSVDVSREHQDPDDDVARVAAVLYQRILESDMASDDTPDALRAALQDRLLPGMGVCRIRYDMKTQMVDVTNELTGMTEQVEQIAYESAPVDYVHWQDFRWGWGRTWAELEWIGFRSWLSKPEAINRFGQKKADSLEYKNQLPSGDQKNSDNLDSDQKNNVQKAEIWEFWCKKEKRVYWFNQGAQMILDSEEDPLKLDGFWPVPRPLIANLTTTLMVPRADYIFAQDLYCEIDVLQTRISAITRAIKVVGLYDKGAGDSVGRMLTEGLENQLIPVDNWAMFSEKGGLQGSIQWFPVQEVTSTLATLQQIQDQKVAQLNEVTGMSEIMRGSAGGQYTAAASNQLSAKFGSINIQALQDEFARFASDCEALKAEVISKHFSPQSIVKQSNAMYIPAPDRDKIQPAIMLMQSPDIRWRVSIRPESIAMIDYASIKQESTDFLTAMATYIQSAQAAAKSMPGSIPVLMELMKWGMRGFKGTDYLEGIMDQAIDMAKNAPPEKDNSQEMQQQAIQAEMQKIQAKSQADLQAIQAKSQAELQKIQMDSQANLAEQNAKNQGDMQKIIADLRADMQIIAAKLDADLQREAAQSEFAVAEVKVGHKANMIEMGTEHEYALEQIEEQNEYEEDDMEEDDDDMEDD